ncbi:MAG: OsmC family peroxiredoxin [Micromonosporaceae bacterium]|nr:OsmC family peroxiredoxin [Micromonosporaceae bacterium]
MPKRSASAIWNGTLTDGNGTMRLDSGAYEGPYSFSSRFEEGAGSNPEELIAAAHAGCFSMAFSATLAKAGHAPESIETTAEVHLTKDDGGFSISRIDLRTTGRVPGIDAEEFAKHAESAKAGCPVSRALGGVEITVNATLA